MRKFFTKSTIRDPGQRPGIEEEGQRPAGAGADVGFLVLERLGQVLRRPEIVRGAEGLHGVAACGPMSALQEADDGRDAERKRCVGKCGRNQAAACPGPIDDGPGDKVHTPLRAAAATISVTNVPVRTAPVQL